MICSFHPGLDDEAADRLAAELGDLPLGLAQAGRYLAETGTSAERLLTRPANSPVTPWTWAGRSATRGPWPAPCATPSAVPRRPHRSGRS